MKPKDTPEQIARKVEMRFTEREIEEESQANDKPIRVYVAGAYSADNVMDVLRNIGRGEKLAAETFKAGFPTFCPWHDKSYVMEYPDADFTAQQFKNHSMAWLEVSNAVLLVPGWENSSGTRAELDRARELGIPFFHTLTDLIFYRDSRCRKETQTA